LSQSTSPNGRSAASPPSPESIEQITSEIETLTEENARIRAKCDQFEQELHRMAQAINHNLEILNETKRVLEQENVDLKADLDRRYDLVEQIEPLFESLREVIPAGQLDSEMLYTVLGATNPKTRRYKTRMDPLVIDVIRTMPYFENCRSNAEFIESIQKLQADVKRLSFLESSPMESELRRKLDHLRAVQARRQSQDAARIRELGRQRDELMRKLERLKSPPPAEKSPSPVRTSLSPRRTDLSPVKRPSGRSPPSPLGSPRSFV
jgi:hypothetical protein